MRRGLVYIYIAAATQVEPNINHHGEKVVPIQNRSTISSESAHRQEQTLISNEQIITSLFFRTHSASNLTK
jgi:hypothetical protein